MTHNTRQPDPAARLVSHLAVGLLAALVTEWLFGDNAKPAGQLLAALLAAGVHELLDAPAARVLTQTGW